jgi:predicted enzyme related to lactoylglutathione lyase
MLGTMAARFTELIVDAVDPHALAKFWSEVLGWPSHVDQDDDVVIADPSGALPTILFNRAPEPKTVKNRLHIDVSPMGCDQQEELARLLDLGARPIDIGQDEPSWIVLADPEGNEFCLLRGRRD